MNAKPDEQRLFLVSMGVVLFSILAVIIFILNISQVVFYLFALIAIVLGFYLSRSLSITGKEQKPERKKGR